MINSRRKGNSAERAVCKILSHYFGGKFERRSMGIPGSDIVCPDNFPYAVEVKHDKRVKGIHLFKGHHSLRGFWKQAIKQGLAVSKDALLIVKVEGLFFVTAERSGDGCQSEWILLERWCDQQVYRQPQSVAV